MSSSESETESDFSDENENITCIENIADPRVEKTIREMMEARGYNIKQDLQEDKVKSLIAFRKNFPDIYVLFATNYGKENDIKFNIAIATYYISYIDKKKLKHIIIIVQSNISSKVQNFISNYQELKKIKIEIFEQNQLKFNITKHELVPKHEVMSKEESKIFKEKFGIKFNIMSKNDPVARFYGYEKGDVVKIYRDDIITYRIVL